MKSGNNFGKSIMSVQVNDPVDDHFDIPILDKEPADSKLILQAVWQFYAELSQGFAIRWHRLMTSEPKLLLTGNAYKIGNVHTHWSMGGSRGNCDRPRH